MVGIGPVELLISLIVLLATLIFPVISLVFLVLIYQRVKQIEKDLRERK
jgi:hypothetical protein